MKTKSSSFLNMLLTLTVVTGVAAVSLGFIYQWTKEPIATAKLEKQVRAIEKVAGTYDNDPIAESYELVPDVGDSPGDHESVQKKRRKRFRKRGQKELASNERVDAIMVYPVKVKNQLQVVAIKASSPNGYSGKIELMVGIDKEGKITNIEVLDHRETPGLGSKIKDLKFIQQYVGKSPIQLNLKVKRDGGDIDAISGATVSTRAFSEAVQNAFDAYLEQQNEEGIN